MGDPTDAERAAFEAGIKFGALYHQFAGTPVSPDSAESLARAMEEAIANQPYCEAVEVTLHEDRIRRAIDDVEGGPEPDPAEDVGEPPESGVSSGSGATTYTELTGQLFDARIEIERAEQRVLAEQSTVEDYPLMELVDVDRR